jgi:hypothetical protein
MAGPRRIKRDVDEWFDELYELYLRRGWVPAVAAIEAHLEAIRRTQPVTS